MKKIIIALSGVMIGISLGMSALAENPKPELVNLSPQQVFVPTGFDSNDNSQVVVRGEFTNTCFKVGPSEVTQDPTTKKISIKNQAYYYNGCFCLFVLVPYDKVIDLGMVEEGKHDLAFTNEFGKEIKMGNLAVTKAKEGAGPDDFLYLPSHELIVVKPLGGTPQAELRGEFSNTCMVQKEVRVIHKNPNVVEILPIAEMKSGNDCQDAKIPFIVKVDLPANLKGPTLLHVRALSGKSLNLVSDF